jgi:uncharacterized paraquat-inducible protein A
MALMASVPRVCHRCTCSVPKHARTCPNCLVPLGEITFESIAANTLLVVLALGLLVAAGWGVYRFLLLGE